MAYLVENITILLLQLKSLALGEIPSAKVV